MLPKMYDFQQKSLQSLLDDPSDKHFCVLMTGAGKTPVQMRWLAEIGTTKALVVTTPSKRDSGDYPKEQATWIPDADVELEVVSWHGLSKWVDEHSKNLRDYAYVFDEVQKAGAGVSSGMGRAFLKITASGVRWTGWTATPGDVWLKFYPYFQATRRVKNKTMFLREFCEMASYRGFPEIVRYRNVDVLNRWWDEISVRPDTSSLLRELPKETHAVVEFPKPTGYATVKRTREYQGKFLDSTMALVARLRQICLSKEKKQWIADFLDGLDSNAVFFVNYIEEENEVAEIAKKAGRKVWRIDGTHHQIPTAEEMGKRDVVVANYAAGSEGLNLQMINHWVAVSLNYSYTVSIQARGRIKRIGQSRPMFFHYLLCDGTIERDILKCLKKKSDFSEKTWAENEGLTLEKEDEM